MRGDAIIGQCHGLDAPGLHAPERDIGVLIQAAPGDEVGRDVVCTDAEAGGDAQVEQRDQADGEQGHDGEDNQLDSRSPVQHYCGGTSWPDAVPGGILNGSAACPDRFAVSPTRKSGVLTTSSRCFMFGSRPNDVVKIVSPSRRSVRSKVAKILK